MQQQEEILPQKSKCQRENEVWKNDKTLNKLLEARSKLTRNTQPYISVTKKVKKQVRFLCNEKIRVEAEEINNHATKREIEELFRNIKTDGSTFKKQNHQTNVKQRN